jgi:hypothetical protein
MVIAEVFGRTLDSAPRHRFLTGIYERNLPRFGLILMHGDLVVAKIEGDIGLMQKVIREVLLDHIALVTKANDEVGYAVVRVCLHDMPKDRSSADLDHRLRPNDRLFGQSRTKSAGKDDCLHDASFTTFVCAVLLDVRVSATTWNGKRRVGVNSILQNGAFLLGAE